MRRRSSAIAATLAAAVVATARGGGSGHPSTAASSSLPSSTTSPSLGTTSTSVPVVDYSSAAEVIRRLGAHGLACNSQSPLSVSQSDLRYLQTATMCTIDGEDVVIATFNRAGQRATYETIGEEGRGVIGTGFSEPRGPSRTSMPATADRIAAAIGGTPH